jgi:UDP:flavonoid glycosyltransferase YjiC (YdhE family)
MVVRECEDRLNCLDHNAHAVSKGDEYAMKFVLASCGSRGDVEPCAAVGLELLHRGHEVHMAVPPNLVGFVESAGLTTVAYGPDTQAALESDFLGNLWKEFPGILFKTQEVNRLWRETRDLITQYWLEMSTTLTSLADGADLLFAGMILEETAANVAEFYDIPFATLHSVPARANGQLVPAVPAPVMRSAMTVVEWLHWRYTKKVEDTQRRELSLSKATGPLPRRIEERGALELQAYDEVFFPGLAAEWNGKRPFVGGLTMGLTTEADDEVASWIAAGAPPIYFGFGSIPVESATETIAMISAACEELGERALVCSAESDVSDLPHLDNVKVVGAMHYASVFPACRAAVHHGGAGTTAASLRAGLPTLVLWSIADQQIWAAQVKRLKVGAARRFSTVTKASLVADLRKILTPEYATRAREVGNRMSTPAASAAAAAELLEDSARLRRAG